MTSSRKLGATWDPKTWDQQHTTNGILVFFRFHAVYPKCRSGTYHTLCRTDCWPVRIHLVTFFNRLKKIQSLHWIFEYRTSEIQKYYVRVFYETAQAKEQWFLFWIIGQNGRHFVQTLAAILDTFVVFPFSNVRNHSRSWQWSWPRESVIIEWPLNGQFHDRRDVIIMFSWSWAVV